MEYRITAPGYSKFVRKFPVLVFSLVYIALVLYCIYLPYKKSKSFDYHSAIFLIILMTITLLPVLFINLLYSKFLTYMISRMNYTVSIQHNYIEESLPLIKKKYFFNSIKKIEILDKNNVPKALKFFCETTDIKGIKIKYKKSIWTPMGRKLLFNIENLDKFIEELKAKIPYHVSQKLFSS